MHADAAWAGRALGAPGREALAALLARSSGRVRAASCGQRGRSRAGVRLPSGLRPGGAHVCPVPRVGLCPRAPVSLRSWRPVPRAFPGWRPFPARREPGPPGASRVAPVGSRAAGAAPSSRLFAPQPGFLSWPSAEGVSWCGLEAGCDCSAGPVSPSGGCRLLARVPAGRPVAEPGRRFWLRMQAGAPGFACLSVRACGGRARVATLDSV